MGGIITSIPVKEGQRVSQGQTLATIDASVLSSNLYEMEAQLEQAKYMLGKQEELKKRGLGTEFEMTSAQAQVKSIEARMRSIRTQTGKSIIKAPFSGTIDKIYAGKGVMAGPASPILRLVNNSSVDITADVSEKHLAKIQIGTPIEVSFPNYKDTVVFLKVTNVGNYIDPTNRTFRITALVKGNKIFLPNMLAELNITDMNVENALVVPATAILRSHDNSEYIFIARKKAENEYTIERTDVKVIENYKGDAYISSEKALKTGDFVVTEGSRNITEKDIVRIK
jgi:RND family efflux transporter MFP subunit